MRSPVLSNTNLRNSKWCTLFALREHEHTNAIKPQTGTGVCFQVSWRVVIGSGALGHTAYWLWAAPQAQPLTALVRMKPWSAVWRGRVVQINIRTVVSGLFTGIWGTGPGNDGVCCLCVKPRRNSESFYLINYNRCALLSVFLSGHEDSCVLRFQTFFFLTRSARLFSKTQQNVSPRCRNLNFADDFPY